MPNEAEDPGLLTLEPLLEAVRTAVQSSGWEVSGIQKTTSYEYEGRWEGETTRSAYLFFHRDGAPEGVSVEAFLDETSRGLSANLSLVLEGPRLSEVESVEALLQRLSAAAAEHLPSEYRRPTSLRYRMSDAADDPSEAELQARLKIHLGRSALGAGSAMVQSRVRAFVLGFDRLLEHPGVGSFLSTER